MPEPIRVLSEADVVLLKAMANEYKRKFPHRPPKYREDPLDQTPEVYIAKTPVGGIPALDSVGTGTDDTPTDGDIPGSAVCDIYEIVDGELQPTVALSQTVYNLSRAVITYTWALITRDKYGRWIASVPAEVSPVDPSIPTRYAKATLSGGSSGGLGTGLNAAPDEVVDEFGDGGSAIGGDEDSTAATLMDWNGSGWEPGEEIVVTTHYGFEGKFFAGETIDIKYERDKWYTVCSGHVILMGGIDLNCDISQVDGSISFLIAGAYRIRAIPRGLERDLLTPFLHADYYRPWLIYWAGAVGGTTDEFLSGTGGDTLIPGCWYATPLSEIAGQGLWRTVIRSSVVGDYNTLGGYALSVRLASECSKLMFVEEEIEGETGLETIFGMAVNIGDFPGRYLDVDNGSPCQKLTLNLDNPADWEEIEVVTDVTFDVETCEMTKTTKTIKVPKEN